MYFSLADYQIHISIYITLLKLPCIELSHDIINFYWCFLVKPNIIGEAIQCDLLYITRPTLERRKTLGQLRSINRNMIIHFANQSQTCQLLKILKNIFFLTFHEKKLWKVVQSIPCWTDIENPYWLLRASYIYIYIYVKFLA